MSTQSKRDRVGCLAEKSKKFDGESTNFGLSFKANKLLSDEKIKIKTLNLANLKENSGLASWSPLCLVLR